MPWDQIPAAKYQQVESDSKHQDHESFQLAKEHVNRIANDVEFKFIDQDIKRYQLEKDDTTISLNEKHRELEADKADQEALNRINKRQKLAKKPVFKALDDVPKDYEAPDAYLDEAVSITADLSKI